MANFKVEEGADKVGAWAIKYNQLVDEVIESIDTVDDGVNVTITYNKIGGGTFTSVINKSNVVTGKTYDDLLQLVQNNDLIEGMYYELQHNTIDSISNTDVVFTGATETLLLTPANPSSFHVQVISKTYPYDIIYYDFSNNGFDLPNGNRVYRNNGYIYYRHDTNRNIKVSGYDFRTQIMYRYPVDRSNYNQYNPAISGQTGNIVWYGDSLYVYNKTVGTSTPPDENNSVQLIDTYATYLCKTGSTNYGTTLTGDILLYPVISGVITGYTFSTNYSDNNSNNNYKNIVIESYYTYTGWKPYLDYTSTNYTHKPNICIWQPCNNLTFTETVNDITIFNCSTSAYLTFNNCTNINLRNGAFNNISLSHVSNTLFQGGIQNINIEYSNDMFLYSINKSDISYSEFTKTTGNIGCKYYGVKYSNIYGNYNNLNNVYYSIIYNETSNNNNEITNVSNSYINGGNNKIYDSIGINLGIRVENYTPYIYSRNNYITDSTNINLIGSYNIINGCLGLGYTSVITGGINRLLSNYSTYKPGCQNITSYETLYITKCYFGENCRNIGITNWGVSLDSCNFASNTKNIAFNGDGTYYNYYGISTRVPYDGFLVSPFRNYLQITDIDINNKNFIGLNETNQLVGINFTGGTVPVYTSIESYQ